MSTTKNWTAIDSFKIISIANKYLVFNSIHSTEINNNDTMYLIPANIEQPDPYNNYTTYVELWNDCKEVLLYTE